MRSPTGTAACEEGGDRVSNPLSCKAENEKAPTAEAMGAVLISRYPCHESGFLYPEKAIVPSSRIFNSPLVGPLNMIAPSAAR